MSKPFLNPLQTVINPYVTCLPGGREWVLPTTFETGTRSHQILKHYEGDIEHSLSPNLQAGTPEELIHPQINTVNSSQKELNQQKRCRKTTGVWSLTFNNIHKHIIEHPEQTFATGTSSVEGNQPLEPLKQQPPKAEGQHYHSIDRMRWNAPWLLFIYCLSVLVTNRPWLKSASF